MGFFKCSKKKAAITRPSGGGATRVMTVTRPEQQRVVSVPTGGSAVDAHPSIQQQQLQHQYYSNQAKQQAAAAARAEDRALNRAIERSAKEERVRKLNEERQALQLAEQEAIWESLKWPSHQHGIVRGQSTEFFAATPDWTPQTDTDGEQRNHRRPEETPQKGGIVVIHNESDESKMLRLTLDQERQRTKVLQDRLLWVEKALKLKEEADAAKAKTATPASVKSAIPFETFKQPAVEEEEEKTTAAAAATQTPTTTTNTSTNQEAAEFEHEPFSDMSSETPSSEAHLSEAFLTHAPVPTATRRELHVQPAVAAK